MVESGKCWCIIIACIVVLLFICIAILLCINKDEDKKLLNCVAWIMFMIITVLYISTMFCLGYWGYKEYFVGQVNYLSSEKNVSKDSKTEKNCKTYINENETKKQTKTIDGRFVYMICLFFVLNTVYICITVMFCHLLKYHCKGNLNLMQEKSFYKLIEAYKNYNPIIPNSNENKKILKTN